MTRIIQTGEAVQQQGAKLTTLIPVHIRRSGGRKVVVPAATSTDSAPEHHAPILTAPRSSPRCRAPTTGSGFSTKAS